MDTVAIDIRRARAGDAPALAAMHAAAWRYAYRGILPGLVLERMIAEHGEAWWRRGPDWAFSAGYAAAAALVVPFVSVDYDPFIYFQF